MIFNRDYNFFLNLIHYFGAYFSTLQFNFNHRYRRLEESMDVFEDIINYELLQNTAWVLFLNKIDLFTKKIQTVNLQDTFPEYEGGADVEKAVEFIKNMYLDLSNSIPRENITVHVTCALDTTQVEKVFAAVRDFVASESLRQQGLGGLI